MWFFSQKQDQILMYGGSKPPPYAYLDASASTISIIKSFN